MIDLEQSISWMEKLKERINEKRDYLTLLDQAIGDGDHGVNLSRRFSEMMIKVNRSFYQDIGSLFHDVGVSLLSEVSGASGNLYGTAFIKASTLVKDKADVTILELAHAFEVSVKEMKRRGETQAGDKTMIDVWEPAVMYMKANAHDVPWHDFSIFCKKQMEKTKSLESKKILGSKEGRSSIGQLDPGAVSSYYLFDTLSIVMIESGDNRWTM
ncbi:MAG: dihydroxyacetone kinase subunit DhaL [Bacilli bacterium]